MDHKKKEGWDISLCQVGEESLSTIQNLGCFYIYDMSRTCWFNPGWEVPSDGLFTCIDLSSYCKQPDRYAFLLKVNHELAGFALINKVGSTKEVDWNIGEFFIISKFQGKGVGRYVATELFTRFSGIWETAQILENQPARDFWEKVVAQYTGGKYEKSLKTILSTSGAEPKPHPMVVLRFAS
ncbi:MAG: GNAT family N-acetyltransferase [Chlamydiae bacterium]|nr:GNAT family N-acetyltransferase [Chlamydiota bacterium]